MANETNLKYDRTPSERRENARKAGIASGEARRQKRDIGLFINEILERPVSEQSKKAIKKVMPDLPDEEMTQAALMTVGQVNSAANGNTRAYTALLELAERAKEKERLKEEAKEKDLSF